MHFYVVLTLYGTVLSLSFHLDACKLCTRHAGALHLWERQPPPPNRAAHAHAHHTSWSPRHALGGHFRPVADVAWGVDGDCVLSVGQDQTARIFSHVEVANQGGQDLDQDRGGSRCAVGGGSSGRRHWCEIARPQVRLGVHMVVVRLL